ncbi:hypothetical protein E2C01_096299 [Portunus trituberculatus]|uniref:Uncharacterized protein n=1 Tax=Portunus trituberculatus TaxID=210409 RepID=A0A5B7K6J1_PORTR|nr:hypothetical protein [Portunus trituberculatus]
MRCLISSVWVTSSCLSIALVTTTPPARAPTAPGSR